MGDKSAAVVDLAGLPGVRAQLSSVAADLAAGLNCVWLLPDRMIESGQAEELYRGALYSAPVRIDVPAPARTGTAAPGPTGGHRTDVTRRQAGAGAAYADWDERDDQDDRDDWMEAYQLPYLDLDDDGLDLDLGWQQDPRPLVPVPRRALDDGQGLSARLGKELSVGPDAAVEALVGRRLGRPPVVGVRAWAEPDTGAPRGSGIERLFRSVIAGAKAVGLPPNERPRLLVVARLRDLPSALPEELHLGVADSSVHWWWGALGRLDTATAIAPYVDRASGDRGTERDLLGERVRRALRAEIVVEVCGPDLELARHVAAAWDGRQHLLSSVLSSCLEAGGVPALSGGPPLARIGARQRPGTEIRTAWARGTVSSWEGRLRLHPVVWHPVGAATAPGPDAQARLGALVSQAQQRVLLPWIEEARQRLAARALDHLARPVAAVVADYVERPAPYLRDMPERAFLELQVGELLRAHIRGALALPERDARLLRLLVTVRNILSHRSVLYDSTRDELCDELSQSDLRTA